MCDSSQNLIVIKHLVYYELHLIHQHYTHSIHLLYKLYVYTNNKFMIDQVLNNVILTYSLYYSILLNLYIDKGLLHVYGPTGLSNILNIVSYNTILLSSNNYKYENTSRYYYTKFRHHTIYIVLTIILLGLCI